MCSFLRGVSRWFTPSVCGSGSSQLSKSDSDMTGKLFTFTFTLPPFLLMLLAVTVVS